MRPLAAPRYPARRQPVSGAKMAGGCLVAGSGADEPDPDPQADEHQPGQAFDPGAHGSPGEQPAEVPDG